jgi:hypothetical protein
MEIAAFQNAARTANNQHVIVTRFKTLRGAEDFMHYLEHATGLSERCRRVTTRSRRRPFKPPTTQTAR